MLTQQKFSTDALRASIYCGYPCLSTDQVIASIVYRQNYSINKVSMRKTAHIAQRLQIPTGIVNVPLVAYDVHGLIKEGKQHAEWLWVSTRDTCSRTMLRDSTWKQCFCAQVCKYRTLPRGTLHPILDNLCFQLGYWLRVASLESVGTATRPAGFAFYRSRHSLITPAVQEPVGCRVMTKLTE